MKQQDNKENRWTTNAEKMLSLDKDGSAREKMMSVLLDAENKISIEMSREHTPKMWHALNNIQLAIESAKQIVDIVSMRFYKLNNRN